MSSHTAKRLLWIDCAKAFAIIFVLLDHLAGRLFFRPKFYHATAFAVALFVMLSGFSAQLNVIRRPVTYGKQINRIIRLFLQYAFATLLYSLFQPGWSFASYLTAVFTFSASGPFFFLLFFFQLLLTTPILTRLFLKISLCKHRVLLSVAALLCAAIISSLCYHQTYILPVGGGGQYLLGASYFLTYCLGMLLATCPYFQNNSICWYEWAIPFMLWIILVAMSMMGYLPFSGGLFFLFGEGYDPPGFSLILQAFILLLFSRAFFCRLEQIRFPLIRWPLDVCAWLGRHTLSVYMYHLLILQLILLYFPSLCGTSLFQRVFTMGSMLFLPPVVSNGLSKLQRIFLCIKQKRTKS